MKLFVSLAALALMTAPDLAPALAHAETPLVSVAYNPSDLATASGVLAVKANVATVVAAYCRAHPVDHTVADCRANMTADLNRAIDARARIEAGKLLQSASR